MYYSFILTIIGAVLLGVSNGINGVEMTLRNISLFIVSMSCVFIGGYIAGKLCL